MKKRTQLIVLTFFCFSITFAQSGTLDPTFGANGIIRATLGSTVFQQSAARQTIEGNDKSLYILLDPISGAYGSAFTKRFPNGSLDSTYGVKGYSITLPFNNAVAALQHDGKIVVAGQEHMARLNTNGNLDSTFGNNGIEVNTVGSHSISNSILIQSDGKIVVAGSANTGQGQFFFVARYNADGSADLTFNRNGQSLPNFGFTYVTPRLTFHESDAANAIAQQADGKLLVAGQVTDYSGGGLNYAMVRYNIDGSFDSSFGVNGQQFGTTGSSHPLSLGLQTDSKIILGTYIENLDSSKVVAIRYTANGYIDSTFGTNGTGIISPHLGWLTINSLGIQSDGKIVMGGNTLNYTAQTGTLPGDFVIAHFNNDGTPDNTFGTNGIVITDFGNSRNTEKSIFIQTDDKIIASGFYSAPSNDETLQVSRYNLDGSLDNTFNGNGKLVGTFTQGVTRFYSTAIQTDGKVLAAGYTSNGNNHAFVLVRYTENGIPDSVFAFNGEQIDDLNSGASSSANSMVVQPDGKIILAGEAGNSLAVARYNTDGSLDASFNGSGHTIIGAATGAGNSSLALQADGKIVIGSHNFTVNGTYRFAISRLNTDGTLDTGFNHTGIRIADLGLQANSTSIVIQPDGKILQAGIAYYSNGQSNFRDFALVRYNTDGSIDSSFGNNGQQISAFGPNEYEAYCIALQNDGKIVVAGDNFAETSGIFSLAVARYKINGQLDSSFNNKGFILSPLIGSATAIAITEDGKIALGGSAYPGNFAITLLNSDGTPDATFGNNALVVTSAATATGTEGRIQSMVITNNALFAAGFGSAPGNIGMIAKYALLSSGALPVTLVDFSGVLKNKTTLLQWRTSDEYNLSKFLLQRSANGNSFLPLASIKATGANKTKNNYAITDWQPLPGTNYYRLQLVDIDGRVNYSNVIVVNNNEMFTIKLFPNPVHDILYIHVNGNNKPAIFQLIAEDGKIIDGTKVILSQDLTFPVNIHNLSKGIYNLRITTESGTKTLQFIKE